MTRAEEDYIESLATAAIEKVKELAAEPSFAVQAELERRVVRKLCHMYGVTLIVSPAA